MAPLDDSPTTREAPRHPSADPPPRVQLDATTLDDAGHATRYKVGDALGEGAMGEVRRCRDRRIGREVAMKVVRAEAAQTAFMRERFLREARIQGQLEHPCIVPVYDIGLGADGATYFTMKRVRGETLEAVIESLRSGDPAAHGRWSRRKLLAAFSTVCGAVAYAHTRGVVHRDLKPSNLMFGDFGEVYVLDWGVARVLDGSPDDIAERVQAPMPALGRSAVGTITGTAGYMAPEQLMGVADLDGRSDLYALGAILFELLALDCLHAGGTIEALISSTLTGIDARPSARAPDRGVPPELDAICVKATAQHREHRFADARELRDAIERFLDGDRDLERRRGLAAELSTSAERSASRALAGDDDARAQALREVGQALALDPANPRALRTFVGLLVEPPRAMPPEVEAELRADESTQFVTGARNAVRTYLMWLSFIPGALWLGVRNWTALAVMGACILACAAIARFYSRGRPFTPAGQYALITLNTAGIASMGRLFGPFVLLPAAIFSMTAVFSLTPDPRRRNVFKAIGAAGIVAPALLDVSGLVEPSYVFREGLIELLPRTINFPAAPTFVALVALHVATLMSSTRLVGRIRDAFEDTSRRLHLLAWQLRQIVPNEAAAPRANVARAPEACSVFDGLPRL